VTHSTTNTAARELLASALDECSRPTDAAEVREGRNPFVRGEYALAAIEKALTQQQGGEQEAGDCGDEALQRAYWLGWRNSAAWADRKDLWADRDSPAYTQERDDALGTLAAAVKLGKE